MMKGPTQMPPEIYEANTNIVLGKMRKRALMLYNIFFWLLILVSVTIILLVFTIFYDPQGWTWPVAISILVAMPMILVTAHFAIRINLKKNNLLSKRMKFGAGGITFIIMSTSISIISIFFAWNIGKYSTRTNIGAFVTVFFSEFTLMFFIPR